MNSESRQKLRTLLLNYKHEGNQPAFADLRDVCNPHYLVDFSQGDESALADEDVEILLSELESRRHA